MERAGDIEGKRNEDKEPFKGLMMTKDEVALLRNQKKELELKLEKKTNEVLETAMRLKRLEKETEERAKAELKIVKEKEDLRDKVEKLQLDMSEAMKSKITEIDHLKEENQKLHKKFAKREMKNIDDRRSKEQEDIIDRYEKSRNTRFVLKAFSICCGYHFSLN